MAKEKGNIKKAFTIAFPYTLLLGAFNPMQALVLTLMLNARHLFYGISMLDKYRGTGWKKFYLIFGKEYADLYKAMAINE